MIEVDPKLVDELLAVVRRDAQRPGVVFAEPPAALTGGFWARLVRFRLEDPPPEWEGPLVARIMPDPSIAAKETAFQRIVASQGYPTPRVVASGGPDVGIDGQAYLVMGLAEGHPMLAGLDGIKALHRLPSLGRSLPAVLGRALARLHALDPAEVVSELDGRGLVRPTLPSAVEHLATTAAALDRPDLADATAWLIDHPAPDAPVVLCHGDLHPFNVLVDEQGAATVLDWSAAMLAPATYDLAFTSLLLAEPPLVVPRPLRTLVRSAGGGLSRRFLREYETAAHQQIGRGSLEWHQAVICIRALVEVAGWSVAGTIHDRSGHPWVIAGEAFASRLTRTTGVMVRPR